MNSLIDDIISNVVLSSKPCSKFLENDGISTRFFLLRNYDNKKLINFKDVKTLRNRIPTSGLSITLVKNFDEYQYIICGYVPKLNDNNFYKIKFQKIRILVFLFFNSLSRIITGEVTEPDILDEWNKEANSLLIETSQIILDYRESSKNNNIKSLNSNEILNQNIKLKRDYFNYFEMNEDKVDNLLFSIYGIKI
ncbi:MAG: hypothetical protein M3Z01_06255 [Thermoproteota archaeon]|nr:hypothetical protein [Thermoproteota archaeon]